MQYLGIDFGTSNSLASVIEDGAIDFVNFPDGKISNPTVLDFQTKPNDFFIGNQAIERYLTCLEEHKSVGRLMLGIKTLLPEANFDYTSVIGHGNLTAADLVTRFLVIIKRCAEEKYSREFEGAVLGRPVQFNRLARQRLQKAAHAAGFRDVHFWLEPVAAGLAHEIASQEKQMVCVVDVGGGTSDVCIIESAPERSGRADREDDIKAVSGVNLAGDEFSSLIMREKLAPHFGEGSLYRSLGKDLPFPAHIIHKLGRWHRINQLNDNRDRGIIAAIQPTSDRLDDIDRLRRLITEHLGFGLFQAIDAAKRQLSESGGAQIVFPELGLREPVSSTEFSDLILPVTHRIRDSILGALRLASLSAGEIDAVLLTGGSFQVPAVSRLVSDIFGEAKITRPDFFGLIATGLGHAASHFQ